MRYSDDWIFFSSDLCKLAHQSSRPTKYYSCQSAISLASRSPSVVVPTGRCEQNSHIYQCKIHTARWTTTTFVTELRATCFLCLPSHEITNTLFSHLNRTNATTITHTNTTTAATTTFKWQSWHTC